MKNGTRAGWRGVALALVVGAGMGCVGEDQRVEASRLDDFARFGRSVSISGIRAAVGAYQEDGGEGAVYVYSRRGNAWSLEARLTSPTPGNEQFGDAVALSGNYLAIGAPLDNQPGAVRSGSVYVYERDPGNGWQLASTLASPFPNQAWEAFGVEVAIDADTERMVVGAVDRDQGTSTDAGAAFVFERGATGSWTLTQALAAPAPTGSDKFGNAIALDGGTIAVAALRREVGRNVDAGSVFVFEQSTRGFALAQTVSAGDPGTNAIFGTDLALEELPGGARRLVVGAESVDRVGAANTGAVYVFDAPAAGLFAEVAKLEAADGAADDILGSSVALSGTRILAGAPGADGDAPNAGAAYVFELAGTWSEVTKLERTGNDADANANFGGDVSLAGPHAMVGAANEAIGPSVTSTGAAHAYVDGATGTLAHGHVLHAASSAGTVGFGREVDLGGDLMVAASFSTTDVLRRDAEGWSLEQAIPATPGRTLTSASTDGTRVLVTSRASLSAPALGVGSVYTQDASGAWTLEQELTPDLVGGALPEEAANSMVSAIEGDTLVIGARRYSGGDGRVFVYERSGTTWTASQTLESPLAPTQFDMNFGQHVRLQGNLLIVAEVPSAGNGSTLRNGRVFVFERPSATADFVQAQILEEPTPAVLDRFGFAIAIDGDLLAVYGTASSTLRVYRRTAGTYAEVWSAVESDGGRGLAMNGDLVALGAPAADLDGTTNVGEVRVFARQSGDTYVLDQVLEPMTRPAGLGLGQGVAMDATRVVAAAQATEGAVYDWAL
ncbi:MAG: hypothetical protein AAGH15_01275 [Myxococcota bacterium]